MFVVDCWICSADTFGSSARTCALSAGGVLEVTIPATSYASSVVSGSMLITPSMTGLPAGGTATDRSGAPSGVRYPVTERPAAPGAHALVSTEYVPSLAVVVVAQVLPAEST